MSRKRKVSLISCDDDDDDNDNDDYCDEKYNKGESGERAPRNAANARERARMRVLSKAFCRLKKTIPWVPADTKLSKLDTLRLALSYISQLQSQLHDDGDQHPDSTKPLSLSMSWPFPIQATNQSVYMNNSCAVSSTSSTSSTDINHYNQSNNQVQHDVQDYHQANNHSMQINHQQHQHHQHQYHHHHHQHHQQIFY